MKTKKKRLMTVLKKNLSLVKELTKHWKVFPKVVVEKTVKKPWSELVQLTKKPRTLPIKVISSKKNEN